MQIILGSKSVRRNELLKLIGYDFIVDYVEIDENIKVYSDPVDYVEKVVLKKGAAVSAKYPEDLVICADTIVVVDNIILGKPKDEADARQMINLLKNNTHKVITGVYVKYMDYLKVFSEETIVYFDQINDEEIENYIKTKEPYDKSGSYAIQGTFAKYVKKINGDFYNVMGLPINKLYNEIEKIKKISLNN